MQFVRGRHAPALLNACRAADASTIFATKRYEPAHVRGDADVASRLADDGVELVQLPGHLLFEPEKIRIDMRNERYFFGTLMPFLHAAEKSGGKPGKPLPPPPDARIVDVAAYVVDAAGGDDDDAAGDNDAVVRVDALEALGLLPPSDADVNWLGRRPLARFVSFNPLKKKKKEKNSLNGGIRVDFFYFFFKTGYCSIGGVPVRNGMKLTNERSLARS